MPSRNRYIVTRNDSGSVKVIPLKARKSQSPPSSTHSISINVDLSSSSTNSTSKTFKSKAFASTSAKIQSHQKNIVKECYTKTIESVHGMLDSIVPSPPELPPRLPKRKPTRKPPPKVPPPQPTCFALVFGPLSNIAKPNTKDLQEEFFKCPKEISRQFNFSKTSSKPVKTIFLTVRFVRKGVSFEGCFQEGLKPGLKALFQVSRNKMQKNAAKIMNNAGCLEMKQKTNKTFER